ncbi:transcription elongation factor SPT6 [Tanacetum coccineum]
MSDSSFSDSSDLDDIAEYEMIMEINNEDQDEVEVVRMRRYINHERDVAEERLMANYFGPHPKYPPEYFIRRYRMNRELFLEIVQGIENYIQTVNPLPKHFQFFTIRYDCTGLKSFSVIMKCTSAIRQLAYGTTSDALDEYLQMGAHCARDCLDYFCMCVMNLYQPGFLRKPTLADIQNLYAAHNRIHGFPGMLGSIDCMHWEWVNCPKSWHDQYGRADNEPVAPYVVNGQPFDRGYYLADGEEEATCVNNEVGLKKPTRKVNLKLEAIKTRNLGADCVKEARLQTLITEFENLKMLDNGTIDEYAAKLSGIASKLATLGEVMSEYKLVKKFLSSLPRRFVHIMAALEQVLDLKTTGFEDVVGRLTAYEERVKEEDIANDAQENFLYARTEYSNGNNDSSGGRGRGSYS